jgi:hypothetical protein
MRRSMLLAAALGAVLVFPTAAAAKGPSAATISGPGLAHALTIEGFGEDGGNSPLGILVSEGGFFSQVFEQTPVTTLRSGPTDALGARYVVTYTMPGGPNGDVTLRQELYPYAAKGPATYMPPGQKFWDSQSTPGGWYRGSPELKRVLVKAGLPAVAPAVARPRSARGHKVKVTVGAGAGAAVAGTALWLLYRRRHSTSS